ncbi:hypothetical protein YC2023_085078 [Brassica napus]
MSSEFRRKFPRDFRGKMNFRGVISEDFFCRYVIGIALFRRHTDDFSLSMPLFSCSVLCVCTRNLSNKRWRAKLEVRFAGTATNSGGRQRQTKEKGSHRHNYISHDSPQPNFPSRSTITNIKLPTDVPPSDQLCF